MKFMLALSIFLAVVIPFAGMYAMGEQTKAAEKKIVIQVCKEDSLRKVNDSLKTRLFLAEYKIQRVKYYLHIAINKPSQRKFLTSWISRAVQ